MQMPQFYTELGWWAQLTGRNLYPWEVRVLYRLFLSCLSVANEKSK